MRKHITHARLCPLCPCRLLTYSRTIACWKTAPNSSFVKKPDRDEDRAPESRPLPVRDKSYEAPYIPDRPQLYAPARCEFDWFDLYAHADTRCHRNLPCPWKAPPHGRRCPSHERQSPRKPVRLSTPLPLSHPGTCASLRGQGRDQSTRQTRRVGRPLKETPRVLIPRQMLESLREILSLLSRKPQAPPMREELRKVISALITAQQGDQPPPCWQSLPAASP